MNFTILQKTHIIVVADIATSGLVSVFLDSQFSEIGS